MGTHHIWKKIHTVAEQDITPLLMPTETRRTQQIVGSFLYYARAIDNKIHPALNDIGS